MIPGPLRKKITQLLTGAALALFAVGLTFYGKETSAAALEGLKICGSVLVPSLFPFLVVSQLAVQTGLAAAAGRAFRRPMGLLFNLPGVCAPAFILGLIGGYPVGARAAISLYEQRLCTRAEAERLLSFCNNSGPAFILGAVGAMVFGTTAAGVLLYASHVLASVLVGLIFRRYKRGEPATPQGGGLTFKAVPLGRAFTASVSGSLTSILNICAFVVFFSASIRLLMISGVLPGLAGMLAGLMSPLSLDADFAQRLLSGLLEVTSGVYSLASASVGMGAKLSAAAFMLGWAGLSVHCQVLNFIGESGLSTLPYIGGKALHGLFSALLAYIFAWMLPFDAQVARVLSGHLEALEALTPFEAFGLSLGAVVGVWLFFFLLSARILRRRKKRRR